MRPAGPRLGVVLAGLSLVALSLRWYAATDDFWLDEIFNYFLARDEVHSLTDVFTGITVEHQLMVTLSMYLLGDQSNWFWYRLPSVLAGTGTLALMALAGYRRMRLAALSVVLAVAAVSYPLVVYSSEARGYAPAAFFALAMFVFIGAYWRSRSWWHLAGFWSAAIIAVLYHPAAVCVSLALGVWSLVREWRLGGGSKRIVRELAVCHGIPLAVMAWLYLGVMRQWGSVGGNVLPLAGVIGDTMAAALGLPMGEGFRWWALLLGSALIVSGLWVLARLVCSDVWIFYCWALLLAPALMLVIGGRTYVYVRYFVVLFPFFFLMLGEAMDAVARRFPGAQIVVAGLCALTVVGNVFATADFLRVGRGGYRDAVAHMSAGTPRSNVTVAGDQDFQNAYPISFYGRYLPKDRSLVYLGSDAWPPEGPDWYLVNNRCRGEDADPGSDVTVRGRTYRLVRSYPVLCLTGVGVFLYRNESRF